jgi:hypothetical protein
VARRWASGLRSGLFVGVLIAMLNLGGGAAGYRRKPLVDRRILQDLQNIKLAALQPSPAASEKPKSLSAQGSFDPSKGITPDDAVLLGEYLNPNIRAFRLEQGDAEGELTTAHQQANPELQISLLSEPPRSCCR